MCEAVLAGPTVPHTGDISNKHALQDSGQELACSAPFLSRLADVPQ